MSNQGLEGPRLPTAEERRRVLARAAATALHAQDLLARVEELERQLLDSETRTLPATGRNRLIASQPLLHPGEDLLGRTARYGTEDVVVRSPDDPIRTQVGAVSPQPTPDERPGHDRIHEPGQGINRNLDSSSEVLRMIPSDEP